LRPHTLRDFVGQERLKKILGMSIQAARARSDVSWKAWAVGVTLIAGISAEAKLQIRPARKNNRTFNDVFQLPDIARPGISRQSSHNGGWHVFDAPSDSGRVAADKMMHEQGMSSDR
jgi:hypothetical protein